MTLAVGLIVGWMVGLFVGAFVAASLFVRRADDDSNSRVGHPWLREPVGEGPEVTPRTKGPGPFPSFYELPGVSLGRSEDAAPLSRHSSRNLPAVLYRVPPALSLSIASPRPFVADRDHGSEGLANEGNLTARGAKVTARGGNVAS